MKWLSVKIYLPREGIEPLCGRLYRLGVTGVQIEDSADFDEFVASGRPRWDYIDQSLEHLHTAPTSVTCYLTDDAAGAGLLGLIRESVGEMRLSAANLSGIKIEVEGRDDEEWADSWKQYYKPFAVGERLLVCPEWEPGENPDGRTVLRLNPGHLFGTGTHESTRMCLEAMEGLVRAGDDVLDLGAGSGILSVAALLLGAGHVTAVDVDPGVTNVVTENLALNGYGDCDCDIIAGDILSDDIIPATGRFGLVLANIVADVIIPLAPKAYRLTRGGGAFVASGIIRHRAEDVSKAISAAGFEITQTRDEGDWICLVCLKSN